MMTSISHEIRIAFQDGSEGIRYCGHENAYSVGDIFHGDQWHGSGRVIAAKNIVKKYEHEYEPEFVQ